MRGKGQERDFCYSISGITPAYAGKRAKRPFEAAAPKDHPRVCGEKAQTDRPNHARIGSPPRMRGKEEYTTKELQKIRITPAYAGKRR